MFDGADKLLLDHFVEIDDSAAIRSHWAIETVSNAFSTSSSTRANADKAQISSSMI